MTNFNYKREKAQITAYGKTFDIPAKTAVLMDEITAKNKALADAKTSVEIVEGWKSLIAVVIGNENVNEIYPNAETVDTDEIMAFWIAINNEMNQATTNAFKKYMPNREVRRAVK